MANRTPVLNKIAISPPAPAPTQPGSELPPAQPPSPELERVVTAMEFGAALEDLVAHARLRQQESYAEPRASGPKFPPDLLIHRAPTALLLGTCQKLLKLEPMLLGLDQPQGPMSPQRFQSLPRSPTSNGHQTAVRPSSRDESSASDGNVIPMRSPTPDGSPVPNGHPTPARPPTEQAEEPISPSRPPGPAGTSTSAGSSTTTIPSTSSKSSTPAEHSSPARPSALVRPSSELKIKQKVDTLLRTTMQSEGDARNSEHSLSDLGELDKAISRWNDRIVELIIDSPAVLSGYRVGKALSLTQWRIWAAKHWNQTEDPSVDPWNKAFCKQRIDEIQRHVNALSTVLDPQAVTAVSTGLGYWRNALLSLTSIGEPSSVPSWWHKGLLSLTPVGESSNVRSRRVKPSSSQTIKLQPGHGEKLLVALEEQIVNWLDLLTGQRPPGSFPVVGIVSAMTKKMTADLWARLFRFLIPVVAVAAVLVVLGALGWAVYQAHLASEDVAGSGGLLGSLGTALCGVITFLAVQGRALLGRGTLNGAWGRASDQGLRNGGFPRGNYGSGAHMGVAAGLKQDVLSSVVEQIRLEELNLAVSEPLMRCVLTLNNWESKKGDPLKDAERFLRLIYRDKSNLDRLRPVFKDLYKH